MKFTSEDLLKAMGLKVGDRLDTTHGGYTVINNKIFQDINLVDKNGMSHPLSSLFGCEYTIIQPKPTLTEDEKVILRNLPKKYKWIARDKNRNELFIYEREPIRLDECFEMVVDCERLCAYNHLFQFIKWEDEPYSIEELLKE